MGFWPATSEQLKEKGYRGDKWATCSGPTCTARILWAWTPAGKRMPLVKTAEGLWSPHWADCADAPRFSKKGRPAPQGHQEQPPRDTE